MRAHGLLLAGLLALASCTDAGPPVGPGTVRVTLDSPHGAEGAAVLLLVGEGVARVRGEGEIAVYSDTRGETTRVVVVHPDGGTLWFTVDMVERSRPLAALVEEVAGPDDEVREDLDGYAVRLGR